MFSGFQSNAFQRNAFQINGGGTPVIPVRDVGFSDYHRKKYLKYLNILKKLNRFDEYSPKTIKAASEIIEDIPLITPEISKISSDVHGVNISALSREIELIQNYLETLRIEQEQDDELAILLMIN